MSYSDRVKERHESNLRLLGSFIPPTAKTIAAAELMKTLLAEANYPGTMAVSITEFQGELKSRDLFLVAFSGYHPNLRINRAQAAARLSQRLSSEARYWFAEEMDPVYHPMHTTTVDFFKKVFGNSFTARTAVSGSMVDQATDSFADLFEDPTAYTAMKKNMPKNKRKAPLYGVLGSALALRMNLVEQADVPHVVRKLRKKIAEVSKMSSDRKDTKWNVFFGFVKDVLTSPTIALSERPAGDGFITRAPSSGDADIDSISKEAINAWGANALGRFCAEPKAYAAARQLEVSQLLGQQLGKIKGQLAFWYSNETPARKFSAPLLIIGPEGQEDLPDSGGYMAPCTSCRNRSAEMQIGM